MHYLRYRFSVLKSNNVNHRYPFINLGEIYGIACINFNITDADVDCIKPKCHSIRNILRIMMIVFWITILNLNIKYKYYLIQVSYSLKTCAKYDLINYPHRHGWIAFVGWIHNFLFLLNWNPDETWLQNNIDNNWAYNWNL